MNAVRRNYDLNKRFFNDVDRYLNARVNVANPASYGTCLLYTSPSPRDKRQSRMPSSA